MKSLIVMLFILSTSAWSAECRVTGQLADKKEVETSFELQDEEACQGMIEKARTTNFFGLIEKASDLESADAAFEASAE